MIFRRDGVATYLIPFRSQNAGLWSIDNKILSFDVVSMFTNITGNVAMACVRNRWSEIKIPTPLKNDQIIEALELCVNNSYFRYNDKLYAQVSGCSIGSRSSPVVFNIVMKLFIKKVLVKLAYTPRFLKRYVGNIVTEPPEDSIDKAYNIFKNIFRDVIKVSKEKEINNSISFLEVNTIRDDTRPITNRFQEPTSSGGYMNFCSHNPLIYQINIIHILVDRSVVLSDKLLHSQNIKLIKNVLIANNYKPEFFESPFLPLPVLARA